PCQVLGALAVDAEGTLTAYAASPRILPAAIVLVTIVVVVASRPEYGIALALALAPWTNMRLHGGAGDALHLPGKPFHLVLPALAFGLIVYGLLVAREERAPSRSPLLSG